MDDDTVLGFHLMRAGQVHIIIGIRTAKMLHYCNVVTLRVKCDKRVCTACVYSYGLYNIASRSGGRVKLLYFHNNNETVTGRKNIANAAQKPVERPT